MATLEELTTEATAEIEAAKPLYKQVNNERLEFTDDDYAQAITDLANSKYDQQENGYKTARLEAYPSYGEQLDYIYHNGLEAWKTDIIQPIKEAHPKPDSA
jgi:hypothetical protein